MVCDHIYRISMQCIPGIMLGTWILFLLYINYMTLSLEISKVPMYTNNTNLVHASRSIDDMTNSMKAELENLKNYNNFKCCENNVYDKRHQQETASKRKKGANTCTTKMFGEPIEEKTSIKYLGITLDNELKWKDYVNLILSKISRDIGMIKHAKKTFSTKFLKMLYLGLGEPHTRYCCSVLGSCRVTTRQTLDKLQNRAIRIITNSAYDESVEPY